MKKWIAVYLGFRVQGYHVGVCFGVPPFRGNNQVIQELLGPSQQLCKAHFENSHTGLIGRLGPISDDLVVSQN